MSDNCHKCGKPGFKTDGQGLVWCEKCLNTPPIVRMEPKFNRNAPCKCGSGKKFKKCCLNTPKIHGHD